MKLKDFMAISGEGTLFRFLAQGKNAVIVENLETGRRLSAGPTARVSALEEIAIFTTGEDLPLGKVMDRIWDKEKGGETISHKLPDDELKNYFAEVLPEYDRERVYTSDIKKVLHWYNILHKLNLLVKEEEEEKKEPEAVEKPAEETTIATEEVKASRTKKKPVAAESAKKTTAKKTSGRRPSADK